MTLDKTQFTTEPTSANTNYGSNSWSPDRSDKNNWDKISLEKEQQFLLNAYQYEGGFKTGEYLIPFPIEGYYDYRREFSHYTNYFGAIVDAMVQPVYDKSATRELVQGENKVNKEEWEKFKLDCDGAGTAFHPYMEPVATAMRATSITFVVVDNFSTEAMAETRQEAMNQRQFPYIYHRLPTNVYDHLNDKFGRTISIIFEEKPVVDKDGQIIKMYREWTDEYTVMKKLSKDKKELEDIPETYHEHGLGILPVVKVADARPFITDDLFPKPRMYGIGRQCHALFNFNSEFRDMQRKTFLNLLTIQGDRDNADIAVGNGNALFYSTEASNAPSYASPDSAVFKEGREERASMVEQLYRIAQQNGVVGIRQAASGIALQYDFRAYRSVLKETARIMEKAEIQIYNIFAKYMGWDESIDMPGYNMEFLPHDVSAQLEHDEFILDRWPDTPFAVKVAVDNFMRRFPDATEEEIEEFVQAEEERMAQRELARKQADFTNNADIDSEDEEEE